VNRQTYTRASISLHRGVLELFPAGHPNRSTSLNNLARSLTTSFDKSGEQVDLDEVISLQPNALLPAGHPDRSGSLNDLASSLQRRFEQSGEQANIDEAIPLHREALELQPAGHPGRSAL